MNCPNNKHRNYVPEEDSLLNSSGIFECVQCIKEERDSLKTRDNGIQTILQDMFTAYDNNDIGEFGIKFEELRKATYAS